MELLGKTTIDFIGKRNIAFIISAVSAIVGIIGIVQIARNAANMGIDFSGGTAVQIRFAQAVPLDDARRLLAERGIRDAQLQEIEGGNKLLVKIGKAHSGAGAGAADAIRDAITSGLPGVAIDVESSTEIGPSVGEKLKRDTLTAVGISMLGIVGYIAWRFDFRFGIGAVVATLHDVLAMIGFFYIFGKEINLLFVTAVLTIAGYSLTDTVVVFDRIRENMRRSTSEPILALFNRSINEVLSRTIVTSITTFLAAFSLLVFGGEVIHDFALALVVGIIVATYSSIFVAAPVVALWYLRSGSDKAVDATGEE